MDIRTVETEKTIDVILTDIQLHTQKHRKPLPWLRKIMQSLRNRKPGRVYGSGIRKNDDGTFRVSIPLPQEVRERAALSGKRIRFLYPKGGIPVFLGPDAVEFAKARERRIAEGVQVGHSK